MITRLSAADRPVVPWKNGGGRTQQIAAFPLGSDLSNFGWRLSIAEVEIDGPFSIFPGVERTLAVLEGALQLTVKDLDPPAILTPKSAPMTFDGDAIVHGKPLGGPVRDLNLMVRKDRFSGNLRAFDGERLPDPPPVAGDVVLVVALEPVALVIGGEPLTLGRFDALMVDLEAPPGLMLRCVSGRGYVADLTALSAQDRRQGS